MDGIHDLGGVDGFGAIKVESNEPVFHERWEPIGYATGIIGFGRRFFTVDEFRHAVERMAPRHYLSSTYYERVVTGVASLYVEKGIVSHEELEEAAGGSFPLATPPGEGLAARELLVERHPQAERLHEGVVRALVRDAEGRSRHFVLVVFARSIKWWLNGLSENARGKCQNEQHRRAAAN